MNLNETLQVLAIIKVAYPNSFSKLGKPDIEALTKLWDMQFRDYDYKLVLGAVNTIIATDVTDFMPSIARIKQVCNNLSNPNQIGEIEAWQAVRKAIGNSIYHASEEFEKLPDICKKIVGNSSQLRSWAMMDTDELYTIVQSNFTKSFRGENENERQANLIPLSVRESLMIEMDDDY